MRTSSDNKRAAHHHLLNAMRQATKHLPISNLRPASEAELRDVLLDLAALVEAAADYEAQSCLISWQSPDTPGARLKARQFIKREYRNKAAARG